MIRKCYYVNISHGHYFNSNSLRYRTKYKAFVFSSDELDFKKDEKMVKMFWHWCQNKKNQKAYVYIRGSLNNIWKLEKPNIIIQ